MTESCLHQMGLTTRNILEMSKIKLKKFKPVFKEVLITERIDALLQFVKDDLKAREVEFDLKLQENLNTHLIKLDDQRFGVVLYTLVSNSVKFTLGGHIKVSVKIIDGAKRQEKEQKYHANKKDGDSKIKGIRINQSGSLEDDESSSFYSQSGLKSQIFEEHMNGENSKEEAKKEQLYISVSVSDTGCGMNKDQKHNCFTLFGNRRLKNNINQGGVGLGLASARLICRALKGEIHLVRSEPNEGTKFSFTMAIIGEPCQSRINSVQNKQSTSIDQNVAQQDKNSSFIT